MARLFIEPFPHNGRLDSLVTICFTHIKSQEILKNNIKSKIDFWLSDIIMERVWNALNCSKYQQNIKQRVILSKKNNIQ
jgi:hypothetical protein